MKNLFCAFDVAYLKQSFEWNRRCSNTISVWIHYLEFKKGSTHSRFTIHFYFIIELDCPTETRQIQRPAHSCDRTWTTHGSTEINWQAPNTHPQHWPETCSSVATVGCQLFNFTDCRKLRCKTQATKNCRWCHLYLRFWFWHRNNSFDCKFGPSLDATWWLILSQRCLPAAV